MKKMLFMLIYLFSPVPLILALYNSNPMKYENGSLLFSMILGVIGYTWLAWQFVLSARPKFIETAFGMDKIYRVHGGVAIVSLVLVAAHMGMNKEIFGESFTTVLGDISFSVFSGISAVTLMLMVSSGLLKFKPVMWFRKAVEAMKVFKYEHYRLLHNLTIIALVFMLLHVLRTSGARSSIVVFNLYVLYFIIAVLFYCYHKILKGFFLEEGAYIVQRVLQESPNMWSVHFAPANGEIIKYKPGQFGFFHLIRDGITSEEHPFSISSSPTSPQSMSITVKELGDYTSRIQNVKAGDKVILDAPYGRFSYLNYKEEKETVFIVGGVGITPVLSMLRYMKDADRNRQVALIWGMNQMNDYIVKDELMLIKKEMPNLSVIPVVARDSDYEGEKGFIDLEKLQRILTEKNLLTVSAGFYLCGPSILMDNSIKNLKKLGVNKKRIHFERFSL